MVLFASQICHKIYHGSMMEYAMEVGSPVSSSRFPLTTMEALSTLCFPPFSLIGRTPKKVVVERIALILINSSMAKPALEPNAFPVAIANSVLLSWKSTIITHSQGDSHPPTPSTNDLVNLRNNLETEDLLQKAAELTFNARTVGTQNSYESSWKLWNSWYSDDRSFPFDVL